MFLIWPKDSGWSRASLQHVRCLRTKCFPLFSWENKQVEKSAWDSKLVAEGRLKLGSHTIICGRRHFSEARLNKIRTLLPAGSGALGPVPTPCSSFPWCPHLSELPPSLRNSGRKATALLYFLFSLTPYFQSALEWCLFHLWSRSQIHPPFPPSLPVYFKTPTVAS